MIPLITPNNPRVFFPRIKTALGVFEYFDVAVVRSIYITVLERIRWNLAAYSWQHLANTNVLVDAIGYFDEWWGTQESKVLYVQNPCLSLPLPLLIHLAQTHTPLPLLPQIMPPHPPARNKNPRRKHHRQVEHP